MNTNMEYEITVPKDVQVEVALPMVKFSGPNGRIEKKFISKNIDIKFEGGSLILFSPNATKREKKLMNTFKAHMIHMIVGVIEGHSYKLKVCSGHFPMTVTLKGKTIEVKNYLGENKPRTINLKEGADVKVDGDEITVNSPNKEIAGQVAADIEQITRLTDRDRRIFQDGIYIVEKSKTRPIPEQEALA